MTNFREELNKIRAEKKYPLTKNYEIFTESILKKLISYYEYQDATEVFEAKEINFCIDARNNIIGRIYDMDEKVARDFSIVQIFNSREEAKNVLIYLECEFGREGFKSMDGKSAEKDDQFSVLIV